MMKALPKALQMEADAFLRLLVKVENASRLLESAVDELRSYGAALEGARGSAVRVVSSRFVTIELASEITGFTPSAIRTKITKGVWLEGRQWVKRDGRVLIDMRGYEAWAAGTVA